MSLVQQFIRSSAPGESSVLKTLKVPGNRSLQSRFSTHDWCLHCQNLTFHNNSPLLVQRRPNLSHKMRNNSARTHVSYFAACRLLETAACVSSNMHRSQMEVNQTQLPSMSHLGSNAIAAQFHKLRVVMDGSSCVGSVC